MKIGQYLPTVGRIFTPMAMVVFLALEITRSQQVQGAWLVAVTLGAVFTAVGFEVVGILSGHALEGFSRNGDHKRTAVSFLLLAIYTAAGVYILWGNAALRTIPVVAAIVYIVAALVDGLEEEHEEEKTAVSQKTAFDIEQARLDAEHRRKQEEKANESQAETDRLLALAEVDKETAVALSRNEAQVKIANAKARETKAKAQMETKKATPKAAEVSPEPQELSGKALEIYTAFRENPDATNTEIGEVVGVSRQYVGQVKRELNGALK